VAEVVVEEDAPSRGSSGSISKFARQRILNISDFKIKTKLYLQLE